MNKKLKNIENILSEIVKKEEMKIEEIFRYGDKKIEFMLIYTPFWISVSVVDDMSYDFTVFDSTGDAIIYNNTQKGKEVSELDGFMRKDIRKIKNKEF